MPRSAPSPAASPAAATPRQLGLRHPLAWVTAPWTAWTRWRRPAGRGTAVPEAPRPAASGTTTPEAPPAAAPSPLDALRDAVLRDPSPDGCDRALRAWWPAYDAPDPMPWDARIRLLSALGVVLVHGTPGPDQLMRWGACLAEAGDRYALPLAHWVVATALHRDRLPDLLPYLRPLEELPPALAASLSEASEDAYDDWREAIGEALTDCLSGDLTTGDAVYPCAVPEVGRAFNAPLPPLAADHPERLAAFLRATLLEDPARPFTSIDAALLQLARACAPFSIAEAEVLLRRLEVSVPGWLAARDAEDPRPLPRWAEDAWAFCCGLVAISRPGWDALWTALPAPARAAHVLRSVIREDPWMLQPTVATEALDALAAHPGDGSRDHGGAFWYHLHSFYLLADPVVWARAAATFFRAYPDHGFAHGGEGTTPVGPQPADPAGAPPALVVAWYRDRGRMLPPEALAPLFGSSAEVRQLLLTCLGRP